MDSSPYPLDDGREAADRAQAEQDAHFFASPSSPSHHKSPPNNAAARFYRQKHRRTLSDTSVDSQPGFIDHRAQQASIPFRSPIHSRQSRLRSEVSPSIQRRHTGDEPSETPATLRPDASPSAAERALHHISTADFDNSALADDESLEDDAVFDHRQQGHAMTPSSCLSRQPSDSGKVEEDVCYPMLQMRDTADQVPLLDTQDDKHQDTADNRGPIYGPGGMLIHNGHGGIPGVLPNFPFPFDFNALEEFADREREKEGNLSPSSPGQTTVGRTAGVSFSPDKNDQFMRRRHDGDAPHRERPARNPSARKLSEGNYHSRFQRKLALFEGSSAGEDQANIAKADSKTPLLDSRRLGRLTTNGSTGQYGASAVSNTTEKSRPYRFSFYSNSLPSTIHARSLAEIPADDQSFEELFVGRKANPEDYHNWQDFEANAASRAASVSGTYTPSSNANGASSATKVQPQQIKPKSNLIRTVEDAELNTWWLDVLCPTDQEMKVLGKVFGIHPLTIEDILMEETREKIELFRNYYLVCFRSFDQDPYSPTYLEPLNMYIIVFREGTLSFHFRGTPHPQNVRRRIKQLKDFINVTSDWVSYALIDDITDAFGPLIQNIEYEVDSIDELVLILKDAEQSDMLRRIGTCRKKVMGLLRLMGNKADVVKGLAKRCNENWSVAPKSDIGLYLSDIQDHLITMTQNLNHYEKILSRSHSNYLAQISIEMTDANNQINDVLSKLTALGTVLIPMNLVTGLWGMNVNVPGQGVENLHWFFGIVACLSAFAILGGWVTYRAFSR